VHPTHLPNTLASQHAETPAPTRCTQRSTQQPAHLGEGGRQGTASAGGRGPAAAGGVYKRGPCTTRRARGFQLAALVSGRGAGAERPGCKTSAASMWQFAANRDLKCIFFRWDSGMESTYFSPRSKVHIFSRDQKCIFSQRGRCTDRYAETDMRMYGQVVQAKCGDRYTTRCAHDQLHDKV
jgi:hypothetical protein